jgi:hypothetical protein
VRTVAGMTVEEVSQRGMFVSRGKDRLLGEGEEFFQEDVCEEC